MQARARPTPKTKQITKMHTSRSNNRRNIKSCLGWSTVFVFLWSKYSITTTTITNMSFRVRRRSTKSNNNTLSNVLKKQEEEEELYRQERLQEATEIFQRGYGMCCRLNDPANALVEYRHALDIRESFLGKYDKDTGRTYFWMGKSLLKLQDYENALIAFSRSQRIFGRLNGTVPAYGSSRSSFVYSNNPPSPNDDIDNKYSTWTSNAIRSVFRKLSDKTHQDMVAYKANLAASISHERSGDIHLRKGNLNLAIAEYQLSIDYMDMPVIIDTTNDQQQQQQSCPNPDIVDLDMKIKIAMERRQQQITRNRRGVQAEINLPTNGSSANRRVAYAMYRR